LSVEVLGRYSKLPDQGERLRTLLGIVPEGTPEVKVRTIRRAKQLRDDQVDQLVELYHGGATVKDLTARFEVHRDTIGRALNRRGVVRRERGIPKDRVSSVITAYRAGSSLDMIARELGVATNTVAASLRRAGEILRPAVRY
jgi:transposase-like protein